MPTKKNIIIATILVSAAAIFLYCCTFQVDYDSNIYIPGDVVSPEDPTKPPTCFYESITRVHSTYLDSELRPFRMTVDIDSWDNYKIPAQDVAEIASLLTTAHALMQFPNNNKVYEILKSGHFIVVEDPEIFAQLYKTTVEKAAPYGAFITRDERCWGVPKNVEWSSVIRNHNYNIYNIEIIVHEMVHMVSLATYGDSDSDHKNKLLWTKYGNDSLQNQTVEIYHAIKFPGLGSAGAGTGE